MKRIIALFAILLPLAAMADRVSPQRAQLVAERYLNGNTKAGRALHLVWRGAKAEAHEIADPAFFVFNAEGGGFVIIAGDDAVKPVLAYSQTSRFETGPDMPEALVLFLKSFEDMVLRERKAAARASIEVKNAWEAVERGDLYADSLAPTVMLKTAGWDQWGPYNNLTPEVDGKKTPTGCVATAAAILMYYYKYPQRGHGTLPGYTYTSRRGSTVVIDPVELGHEYMWDQMLENYAAADYYDPRVGGYVARLMYDLGVSAQMWYGPDGSSAEMDPMFDAMLKYFDYELSGRLAYVGADRDTIFEFIARDLDAGHPVLMSGGDHAFIADGYMENGAYVHFNFGWGGTGDGYYYADAMYKDFGTYNEIAISLRPKGQAGLEGETNCSYSMFEVLSYPERDRPFSAYIMMRHAFGTETVEAAVAKYDFDGTMCEVLSPTVMVEYSPSFVYTEIQNLVFHTEALPDEYLRPVCRVGNGEWLPMLSNGSKVFLLTPETWMNNYFRYEKEAQRITFEAYERAQISVKGDAGADYSSLVSRSGYQAFINTAPLPRGHEYVVTVVAGSETREIRFRL